MMGKCCVGVLRWGISNGAKLEPHLCVHPLFRMAESQSVSVSDLDFVVMQKPRWESFIHLNKCLKQTSKSHAGPDSPLIREMFSFMWVFWVIFWTLTKLSSQRRFRSSRKIAFKINCLSQAWKKQNQVSWDATHGRDLTPLPFFLLLTTRKTDLFPWYDSKSDLTAAPAANWLD